MSKLFETSVLSRIDISFDCNFQRRVARDTPYSDVTRSDMSFFLRKNLQKSRRVKEKSSPDMIQVVLVCYPSRYNVSSVLHCPLLNYCRVTCSQTHAPNGNNNNARSSDY